MGGPPGDRGPRRKKGLAPPRPDAESLGAGSRELREEAEALRARSAEVRALLHELQVRLNDSRPVTGRRRGAQTSVRAESAERRDQVADERDRIADERDRIADERDRAADGRDRFQDDAEGALKRQQSRLDERARTLRESPDLLARAQAAIDRSRE